MLVYINAEGARRFEVGSKEAKKPNLVTVFISAYDMINFTCTKEQARKIGEKFIELSRTGEEEPAPAEHDPFDDL